MLPHCLRVASIPERHLYVRHIQPVADGWTVLPDPTDRPWWPPVRLDPGWIDAHHDDFDVFHVHFGFDGLHPDTLTAVCEALRRHAIPLVYTAHDLRNPHHHNRALHDAQTGVLFAHADAVLTLTRGAAAELHDRHGRAPTAVIAHPHIAPLEQIAWRRARRRPRPEVPRVGVHLKSLRPNMAAIDILGALPTVTAEVRCRVVVNVHTDVMQHGSRNHEPAVAASLARLANSDVIDLRVHDYFDTDAFLDYLGSLDVSVLPYRFGTHSGWLEACRDLDVAVAAPDCGYYAEQGAEATFACNEDDGLDTDSLVRAVARAATGPRRSVDAHQRRTQRDGIADQHHTMYRTLASSRTLASAS